MLAIFWRALKDRRISLFVYCLTIIGFIWMYITIYPTIQQQSANLEALLKFYPESLMKAFNVDIATYTTVEGYFSAELFSFIWPLFVIFISVGFAGAAIAGEIEKSTIEVLLSQPISRLKIFFSKYLAGLFTLVAFIIASTLTIGPILSAYNISYRFASFTTIAILGFIFGLAVFSIAMFLSAIFSDKGKVYFISGGLLVVMYVLNVIASLKENLSDLKYFSFFYYFNANKALIYQQIDHWAYWVFLGVAIIFTISAAVWFSKRDISI